MHKRSAVKCLLQLLNYLSSKLKLSISTLLTTLMAHRNLDVQLTLAALLDLPTNASLSLVKRNAAAPGSQFLRRMSLSNVALVLCANYKQAEYMETCIQVKNECIWGHVLSKYGVCCSAV